MPALSHSIDSLTHTYTHTSSLATAAARTNQATACLCEAFKCYQASSQPVLLSFSQKHIKLLPVSEQLPVKGVARHKIAALHLPIMCIAAPAGGRGNGGGARIRAEISGLIESNFVFHMPLVTVDYFPPCFHFCLIPLKLRCECDWVKSAGRFFLSDCSFITGIEIRD